MPVQAQHPLDKTRLTAWLEAHVPELKPPVRLAQFRGGQSNPTYLVTAGERRYVLRKKPPGALLPSAHAVDREFRVMRALQASDIPVPRVCALCTDASVIGTAFFVMAYVDGRIFWDHS